MTNNNNNFPTIINSDYERELHAYELENQRPAVEGVPSLPNHNLTNLSPDFVEFFNTQETQYQQEFYNRQEQSVSSVRSRLCDIRDKLNSKQATLKSQLRQVEEQLREVDKQLDKLS